MKELDLKEVLIPIALRHAENQPADHGLVFLTIPDHIPKIDGCDGCLEQLIGAFVDFSISIGDEDCPIRVAASRRRRMYDMETMVDLRPTCWVQLGIEVQSLADMKNTIRRMPQCFGFGCGDEWGAGAECSLIPYFYGSNPEPAFVLVLQRHKSSSRYSLLIPLYDRAIQ